ncbi:type II toxin-antitoxin system PemK/MazF family toxin [Streptosporangium sp. G11]|uniref:type II toxin-antitoxin system PemK/MazF family toxin n=1 Tax=Streptosporangium sp. G11 TaxID=3436926 RepID=UPI003EC0F277
MFRHAPDNERENVQLGAELATCRVCYRVMTEAFGAVGGLLALLAVIGFCFAAIYGFVRFVRRVLAPRPSQPQVRDAPPDPAWHSRPGPGEIWWAGVPFSDGTGGKVRPCLVIRTHPRGVEVLKITSQDKSHRVNCVRIPTAHWDKRARKDSWLDLDDPHLINDRDFRRRAGMCDDRTWSLVRRRHRTGWVHPLDL